jgi:predicted DNA-binding transcriptional regulator YafY
MSNLELSDLKFQVPIDFKPDNYFQHAVGITVSSERPELVVFKASPLAAKYIASDPIHASQELVKEGKKRITFQLRVMITEELIRAFLSYGASVEIFEPQSLRDEIAKRAKAMSDQYQS